MKCIWVVAALSGCATADQAATRRAENREVVTGSNIPRRDAGDATVYPREALEGFQRTGKPPVLPTN